jgi:hypothetical protein
MSDYPHFFKGPERYKYKQTGAEYSYPKPVRLPLSFVKPVAERLDGGKRSCYGKKSRVLTA